MSKHSLCIQTDTLCKPKKHVHLTCDEFEITSDVPVHKIHECEVLNVKLWGCLGCYFYPKDATIRFFDSNDPRKSMKDKLEKWEKERKANLSSVRFQQWSVKEVLPPEEEEIDEDDEYENNTDDEGEEEEGEPVVADDEDDKDEWMSEEDDIAPDAAAPSVL